MHTPDKTTSFTITRDGDHIITVTGEFELVRWFHHELPFSMWHAVTYEGYSIIDPNGDLVLI